MHLFCKDYDFNMLFLVYLIFTGEALPHLPPLAPRPCRLYHIPEIFLGPKNQLKKCYALKHDPLNIWPDMLPFIEKIKTFIVIFQKNHFYAELVTAIKKSNIKLTALHTVGYRFKNMSLCL